MLVPVLRETAGSRLVIDVLAPRGRALDVALKCKSSWAARHRVSMIPLALLEIAFNRWAIEPHARAVK